eukprot:620543-Pleurochrysis_carterae.AAC.1
MPNKQPHHRRQVRVAAWSQQRGLLRSKEVVECHVHLTWTCGSSCASTRQRAHTRHQRRHKGRMTAAASATSLVMAQASASWDIRQSASVR